MIARPKISRNEWKLAELGAFEVGNFAPLSCPGLSPTDAALKMTRDFKVACVPGDNFYLGASKATHGAKYLRFAFVRSLDVIADAAANLAKLPS